FTGPQRSSQQLWIGSIHRTKAEVCNRMNRTQQDFRRRCRYAEQDSGGQRANDGGSIHAAMLPETISIMKLSWVRGSPASGFMRDAQVRAPPGFPHFNTDLGAF